MTKARRRRGSALEEAVLGAAWTELAAGGYTDLTFERVAARAETSRPVIARRWPSKLDLAQAAIGYHFLQNPVSVPDLGNVREELAYLLRRWSQRTVPHLLHLIFEMSSDMTRNSSNLSDLRESVGQRAGEKHLVGQILERAITRGEIDRTKVTPRIARLPADLAGHQIFMTGEPISDAHINEILDDIFLPLVRLENRS
jgi:AcrR family transcriptional regulator